jgi:hypothetical protein
MATWQEAAIERKSGEIVNTIFNGGIEDYQAVICFDDEYWHGKVQIITKEFDKVVLLADVEATLPENLRNENWQAIGGGIRMEPTIHKLDVPEEEVEALPQEPEKTLAFIEAYFADPSHPRQLSGFELYLNAPEGLGAADFLGGFLRDVEVLIKQGKLAIVHPHSIAAQITISLPAVVE